jgi:hypothetical protein
VVSPDTAFTEKDENDPTGCTTWGVWTDPADGYPKVMLIMGWVYDGSRSPCGGPWCAL